MAESLVLADRMFRKGRISEAEPMYERSLAMLIRTYDEAHPDVDSCLMRLGDIYFAREKFAQALSTYSRLHGLRCRRLSIHHADTVAVLFKVAKCQERLERFEEATKTYEEAISVGEKWLQPGLPLIGSMMESYAILLRKYLNQPQRATEIEHRAKEYRKRYTGSKGTLSRLNSMQSAQSLPFAPADTGTSFSPVPATPAVPAVPAIPVVPAVPAIPAVPAVPAIPAIPAVPAVSPVPPSVIPEPVDESPKPVHVRNESLLQTEYDTPPKVAKPVVGKTSYSGSRPQFKIVDAQLTSNASLNANAALDKFNSRDQDVAGEEASDDDEDDYYEDDDDDYDEKPSPKNPLLIAFVVLVALIVPTFIGWIVMTRHPKIELAQPASQPTSFGGTTLPVTTGPSELDARSQDASPRRDGMSSP
ncbi:MAG TPA: tetratricopeptide repeat protein [Drouetiella sp.]